MARTKAARRFIWCGPVLACLLVGILSVGVKPASAELSFPFDSELTPTVGELGEPNSVAVDDADGDTYLADSAPGVIDVFDTATGAHLARWEGTALTNPPGTPSKSFGGANVAVAANDGTGDVYVLDPTDNVVDQLGPKGEYLRQFSHGFNRPSGIAVDQATGDVYVGDANNGVVDVFSAEGVYSPSASISLTPIAGELNTAFGHGIAVDDHNGDVYVSNAIPAVVFVFNASMEVFEPTWTGSNTPAMSFGGAAFVGVAADNASGDVYVSSSATGVVDVFGSGGEYLPSEFGQSFPFLHGVAVDQESHKVYVADQEAADVFGPAVVVPEVVTKEVVEVHPRSAVLTGTVDPAEVAVTDCHFDFVPLSQFEASGFEDVTAGEKAACEDPDAAEIGEGSAPVEVHADVAGLEVGTTYKVRLQAENADHVPSVAEDLVSFDTQPPPSITGAVDENLAETSVDLNAQINPNELPVTSCSFEYGTESEVIGVLPCSPATLAAGVEPELVTAHVEKLHPNVTYRWRVVATSEAGTTTGTYHTFVYLESGGGLPDGRAYEMVTPVQKNGAVIADATFAQPPDISENGEHVILSSIQCFAHAPSCTGVRHVTGSPYEFTRTPQGWKTIPLSPPAKEFEESTSWAVSADAGTALFSMPTPPDYEDDFYKRAPSGNFEDIGPLSPPADGPQYKNGVLATQRIEETANLSHVVYQGDPVWPLSEGAIELFEYTGAGNSDPEQVGVSGGPGSTELISGCTTSLGSLERADGALSADGRIVYFTAEGPLGVGPCPSGTGPSNEGVEVPFNELYARVNESETVRISGGEAAEFWGASADGLQVFFTEGENLFEGELGVEEGSGKTVLEEVVQASAGDLSGHGPRVQGVMAISSDGSHVYFVAKGVLTAAANSQGEVAESGQENLYVFERVYRGATGSRSRRVDGHECSGAAGECDAGWAVFGVFE
jgi:hypothetical protein